MEIWECEMLGDAQAGNRSTSWAEPTVFPGYIPIDFSQSLRGTSAPRQSDEFGGHPRASTDAR
jgi:hypothetical protein